MKKLLLSLVALMAIGVSAWADGLTVPSVEVRQGKSGALSIYLNVDTKANYASFAIDLQIPEGFACETMTFKQEVEEGVFEDKEGPKAVLDESISSFSIASSYPDESDTQFIRVVAFGVGTYINYAENGEFHLCDIPIVPQDDIAVGVEKKGTISNIHCGLSSGADVEFDPIEYTITIVEDRIIFDENAEKLPTYAANETANIRLTRTINANEWSTIVLPFELTKANADAIFGSDAQFAAFSGYDLEVDEETLAPIAISINFTTRKLSSLVKLAAGTPYLVKTTQDITTSFDLNSKKLTQTIAEVTQTPTMGGESLDGFTGKFTGSFVKTVIPEDGLFVSGNKFYYSKGATNVKGFRAWLELDGVIGKPMVEEIKMQVDGIVTNINDLNIVKSVEGVFTMDGKKMSNDVTRLPKGVYLINGKKVSVK